MLSKVEQSLNKAVDKLKEKAAEVRAELAADQRPVVPSSHPAAAEQQAATTQPGASTTQQLQGLPADSRAQSLHLCGFDISGVSIAGQVRGSRYHQATHQLAARPPGSVTLFLPVLLTA